MAFVISQIKAEDIDEVWPHIREPLLKAITMYEGEPSEEEIVATLKSKDRYLWISYDNEKEQVKLGLITQFRDYHGIPIMVFEYTGGEGMAWLMTKYMPMFYQYAADNDCRFVGSYSIPSVARVLEHKYSWINTGKTPLGYLMLKPLGEK